MPIRIPSLIRTSTAAVLAVLALALAGCGGSDDPAEMLRQGFETPVESANVTVTARVQLRGSSPQAQQPVGLRLTGPYVKNEDNQFPSLDWQVTASQGPAALTARLVTVPDNAFVVFQNTAYEVGRARVQQVLRQREQQQPQGGVADLGVNPATWVVDPQTRGEVDVAGEGTTQVSGRIDVGRMLRNASRVQQEQARRGLQVPAPPITEQQIAEVSRTVQNPTIDVFVAGDDDNPARGSERALHAPGRAAQLGDRRGDGEPDHQGSANVGGDQEVNPPPNPRPIEELLMQFGLGGQPGALPPGATPPGSAPPGSAPPGTDGP